MHKIRQVLPTGHQGGGGGGGMGGGILPRWGLLETWVLNPGVFFYSLLLTSIPAENVQ